MFGITNIVKPQRYIPLLVNNRWKVRILPREQNLMEETPESRGEKPKVKTFAMDFFSVIHRKNLTWAHFKNWKKWRRIENIRTDQKYLSERQKALGPDLAATFFITVRKGKVRFAGNDKWVTKEDLETKRVPNFYVPGFCVAEIDASGSDLCYEGFSNLCNLAHLKRLNLSNCRFVDDWCLSRSHLFANTLEYLDISGCHEVTERGICTLHPLRKLKTLVINDTPNIQNKELVSLMLQDIIPDCEIIGVNYKDPTLLRRIEQFMH